MVGLTMPGGHFSLKRMGWMAYALAVLCLGAAPELKSAEQAFRHGRYEEVLPALERAMTMPLTPAERARAVELRAFTHAAFDQSSSAVDAFHELLSLRAEYALPANASPKLQSLLKAARARQERSREITEAARPSVAAANPPAVESPRAPTRWWVWVGAGVLVAGAAAATAYAVQPKVPSGTLGRAEIP